VHDTVIAVLNWNGFQLTAACVRSLRRIATPHDVLVVDNGSTAPEAQRLRSLLGVEVIELPRNGGVAYGYNAAVRWAKARGSRYVFLLNNDVLVRDPLVVERLTSAMRDDVAVVGPLILDEAGAIFSAGGFFKGCSAGHLRRVRNAGAPYEVAWVDGSAMFVNVEAFAAVGFLSEDFFLYWEEMDWCLRARRKGFRCLVEPTTSIVHLRSRSSAGAVKDYYLLRNGFLIHRRLSSRVTNGCYMLRFAVHVAPRYLIRQGLLGHRLGAALGIVTRAVLWNVRDAWSRRSWRRVVTEDPAMQSRP
jgi:GT2 family glycosyltransferase